jgi:O-antigen/teichoic acid export membrane protein
MSALAEAASVDTTAQATTVVAVATDDRTGRDRLVRNVIASWAGHFVFIVAGFIMPRQIDQQIGQVGLGVWDFGWTAVNYFFLAQIGVGVSVNRYVARYRAEHNSEGLGRLISSALILQVAAALIVLFLTALSVQFLPIFFADRLSGEVRTAEWVIGLLGISVAIRMTFQAFSGVVTGCHRWDLHNLLNATAYAITVYAMLVVLWRGNGLIGISAAYLVGTILNEAARVALAFHVCPELRISVNRATWSESRALLTFGAKISSLDTIGIIVSQLKSMLVLSQIGIGSLAVYSRLSALIRHTETIAAKYSLPLTPTASSLQGAGRHTEVRELVVNSTRFAAYLVWPILIGLAIAGDDVLMLWMGPQYDPTFVLTLMAVGALFPLSQQPMFTILVGLNLHGRFAYIQSVGGLLGLAASLIALRWFHWDLLGLASVSLIVSNLTSFWIAVGTCRQLSIPVRDYFYRSYAGPLTCAMPFAASLLLVSLFFAGHPALTLVAAVIVGTLVLLPLYWRVAPPEMRARVIAGLTNAIQFRVAPQPEG